MAIEIKTPEEIELMREAGRRLASVMKMCKEMAVEGANLIDIDRAAGEKIESFGDEILFKGYQGFPANICMSLNDVVVHGFAGGYEGGDEGYVLKNGDVISMDMGLRYKGWCADMARTVIIGEVADEVKQLVADTEKSFEVALGQVKAGNHIGDIGAAIEEFVDGRYGIVKELTGHGIGRELHEEPHIYNYGEWGTGGILKAGMVIAIEPMLNLGTDEVYFDDWFVHTKDGKVASHHENTVLVTEEGCEILTRE